MINHNLVYWERLRGEVKEFACKVPPLNLPTFARLATSLLLQDTFVKRLIQLSRLDNELRSDLLKSIADETSTLAEPYAPEQDAFLAGLVSVAAMIDFDEAVRICKDLVSGGHMNNWYTAQVVRSVFLTPAARTQTSWAHIAGDFAHVESGQPSSDLRSWSFSEVTVPTSDEEGLACLS